MHSDAIAADHELLGAATREAGRLALDYFRRGDVRRWDKKPGDPVSEADIAVDRLLRKRLVGERADYGWLSEETADNLSRLKHQRVWVVDPIDGTRAFLEGRPEFTIAAALVVEGEPVAAVVFNPATEEFYEATSGGGARLNGTPLRVAARTDLAGARLLASKRTFERNEWLHLTPGAEFRYMNSIALRMAKVASGEFHAAISLSEKSDWDIAAADLIVREAGGGCTTCGDGRFVYNRQALRHPSVLAAAPGVHGILIGLLGGLDREEQEY
ncbi:MAG: 3'(2'),5'-bisphosphate nucleotidase CysQ [Alphaproteobacteria bacterium]|nr:3'(2'),5'-bisphosphate nucleotidase CysQ [Alphaproteobacteria bacterium]